MISNNLVSKLLAILTVNMRDFEFYINSLTTTLVGYSNPVAFYLVGPKKRPMVCERCSSFLFGRDLKWVNSFWFTKSECMQLSFAWL
jgi:hypothetical protein